MTERRLRAVCGTHHKWGPWTFGTTLQMQLQATPYGCAQRRTCSTCGHWEQRARPFDYELICSDEAE